MEVAARLRHLNNEKKGSSSFSLRQALISCVFPVAFYEIEIWLPVDNTEKWIGIKKFEDLNMDVTKK